MKERLFKELIIFIGFIICCLACKALGAIFNAYEVMILNWMIRVYVEMVWDKFYD